MNDVEQNSNSETVEHAERSVLGAIMLSSGKVLDYLTLEPSDYRAPLHEEIHHSAARLRASGTPTDQLTIGDDLLSRGVKFEAAYLHQLAAATVTPSSAEHYARIVSTDAARRRADEAALVIRQMVQEHADPQAIQEQAQKALDGITPASAADPVRFTEETLLSSLEELEHEPTYVPTPWTQLNDMLGGLLPGALYTVGARPGVGKTVVGVQLAMSLATRGAVPIISLEMRTPELHARMISATARVPMKRLKDRTLTDDDWQRISDASPALSALPIAILDRPSATIGEIRRFVTATARRKPLAGVVLDYLQLIKSLPGDRRARHEYISDLTRELKTLAMELQVPVVLLSQLNRQSTQREDKMPELSDLRESGSIEQDSDCVILLHRLPDDPDRMHDITFRVAKNRHGRPGNITMQFRGHYSEITD